MTDYQKQAIDFLNATSTAFTAKFSKNDYHFEDDKQRRDIYHCTLKNKLHRFTFKFGQSTNNSTGYGTNPPTAYDVLACLTKYEVNTFDDFCADYGYDNDSRKAFKIYKAVKREWENIKLLWSGEQLEQLREIN